MRHGRWIATGAALAALAILALWLRQLDLARPPRLLPRCALHTATGLHCPGCGNTRATQALLRGDLAGAMRQNPLFVAALPLLLFGVWRAWLGWIAPERLRPLPWAWRPVHTWILVAAVLAFSILRNLPWPPFTRLAPVPLDSPGPEFGS
jgi:hypothetical protein